MLQCKSPVLANNGLSGHVASTSAPPPRADIHWPMSGFVLFSSAYPPTADIRAPRPLSCRFRFIPASDPAMTQASPSQMACIGGVYAKYPITRVSSSPAISLTLRFLIRHITLLVTGVATNSTAVRRYVPPLGYARTTPGSRHSRPNFRFFGFSSAAPPGAASQDGGAVGSDPTMMVWLR